ncbi:MAG: HNH endonuclease [Bacilli bacterium]|nr:HNH endonuclease [Bacilli bacterium]
MKEVWKDIEGYEGLYKVSNLGNVKSMKYFHHEKEGILIGGIKKYGYRQVILVKKGKVKYMNVHRLVAQTFIPNPLNKPQINHIDGNKLNNCVNNLEWCTPSENQIHAYRTGLKKPLCSEKNKYSKKVNQYDVENKLIKTYNAVREAARENGLNPRDISKCCQNKRKQVGGYKWEYA